MRQFKSLAAPLFATALVCVATASAWAQQVRIIYPQEGQDVRGEVTVRYEGLPPGGYAILKIDGQFKQASAQEYAIFDTISDRSTFTRGDAGYKLDVTVLRPGGAQVGTASVTFNVANNKVDAAGESVTLRHWQPKDILRDSVERYRVFAESNAVIDDGMAAGASGGGGLGGDSGGGAGATESYIPAPLDWQVAALMRRQVRNIGMYNGSANIATAVQESFERQRKSESGGAGADGGSATTAAAPKRGAAPVSTAPVKAPWNEDDKGLPQWNRASETGKYFVKMIEANGTEINATRKAPTIAIADLLPTFPDSPVRPGSTWETNMTILGDLSSRKGVNVTAPITFTAYDTILTPGGESRRCAKLESRFRLPENLAKQIAANLGNKVGTAGGASGGGAMGGAPSIGGGGADSGASSELTPADIEVARTDIARVLWFDMDRRQVLRSEDTIKSYFEIPPAADAAGAGAGGAMGAPIGGGMRGGGMMGGPGMMGGEGGAGGADAAPAEPQKITYNMSVTTWLDDGVPSPNFTYTAGLGTAHSKDSVNEPGLARIMQK